MRRWFIRGSMGILVAFGTLSLMANDRPAAPTPQANPASYWQGRTAGSSFGAPASPTQAAGGPTATKQSPSRPAAHPPRQVAPRTQEPAWLKRMDKHERTTLTGGWALQNWSGGTQTQTTAGDRGGHYAPNSYQGPQFQQWNNVSTRQQTPSWNGTTTQFPQQMWSQGYVSPNHYAGRDAQRWGNMSAGAVRPNPVSGGWMMSSWR